MQKVETNMNVKEPNQAESKELVAMKQKIGEFRHQVGLLQEQQMEMEAQQKQVLAMIQSQKQAFRDRVQNIAKSYEIDLGVVKDGKVWQFDEPNMLFVQLNVQSPAPEGQEQAPTN